MQTEHKTYEKHRNCIVHEWYVQGDLVLEEGYYTDRGLGWRKLLTQAGYLYSQYSPDNSEWPHWTRIYNTDDQLHCTDGPAYIFFHKDQLSVWREEWYINGLKTRDGHPADIHYRTDGSISSQSWYQNGQAHRDNDLPAVEHFQDTGKPSVQKWAQHGNTHRVGAPAIITHFYVNEKLVEIKEKWLQDGKFYREHGEPVYVKYNSDGIVCEQRWNIDGIFGRADDLPAQEQYSADGMVVYQAWYQDGLKHRAHAPASISYKNGKINHANYCVHGSQVDSFVVQDPKQVTAEYIINTVHGKNTQMSLIQWIGLDAFFDQAPAIVIDTTDDAVLYKIDMGSAYGAGGPDYITKQRTDNWDLYPQEPLKLLKIDDQLIAVDSNIESVDQALSKNPQWHNWSYLNTSSVR